MIQTVSISSKNQFTIPSIFAKTFNVQKGQRLIIQQVGDSLVLTPAQSIVNQIAGTIRSKPISEAKLESMISESKITISQ